MSTALFRRRALAILVLIAFSAACFSERADTTEPPPDDPTCPTPAAAQGPNRALVRLKNYAFSPDTLRITRGTTVVWLNCDNDTHTSTSDAGLWSSPIFLKNQTFTRVFDRAGAFGYFCSPHPHMKGVIRVQ